MIAREVVMCVVNACVAVGGGGGVWIWMVVEALQSAGARAGERAIGGEGGWSGGDGGR